MQRVHTSTNAINEAVVSVSLKGLSPFDTVIARTRNSDYKILLIDPGSGKALIEGGHYFEEPFEATLGCILPDHAFRPGCICVGFQIGIRGAGESFVTSRVQSLKVERVVGAPVSVA